MLAFNLGVFFRNLSGAEVEFTAKNPQCDFRFVGAVGEFHQEHDVSTHLSVALRCADLTCTIDIEEEEAVEAPEEAKVEVHLVQHAAEGDRELVHTAFRFEDISLKPHVPGGDAEAEPEPEPPPKAS